MRQSTTGLGPAIRPSSTNDIEAISEIYADAVRNGTATFELVPPAPAEMARRMAEVTGAGFPWLVAEADGTVVGYAYAGPHRTRPAYRWTVEDSVYTAPDHKGRGIGKALLEAVISICEGKGYRQMVAVISDDRSMASVALHRACGFVHAGALPAVGWKHGRWLDTVFMQRALGPGAATPPEE